MGKKITDKKTEKKTVKGGSFGFEESKRNEILKKTAEVFEKIKGEKIFIKTTSKNIVPAIHECTDNNGDKAHRIVIGKKDLESSKTTLERGLGYVAFNTSKNLFVENIDDTASFAEDCHKSDMRDYLQSIYNSFEATRTGSCMGEVFQGFKERHAEANEKKGDKLLTDNDGKIEDPLTALRLAQYGKDEEVKASEFPECVDLIKSVEKTSPQGSLILTDEFVNRVLKPWYLANFVEKPDEPQGGNQGQGQGNGNDPDNNSEDGKPDEEAKGEGESGKGQGTGESEQKGDGNGSGTGEDEDSDETDSEQQSGQLNKHAGEKNWKGKAPSEQQLNYLESLGYDGETPQTRGDASDVISMIKDDGDNPDRANETYPKPQAEVEIEEQTEEESEEWDNKFRHPVRQQYSDDISNHMQGCCTVGPAPEQVIDNDLGKMTTDEMLEQARKQGEDLIEKVEDEISEALAKMTPEDTNSWKPSSVKQVVEHATVRDAHHQGTVRIDMQTVNRLKGLFRNLKSKSRQIVDDSGTDLDVDLYIKNRTEGGCDFLLNDDVEKGFAVVIGIDESASMGGGRGSNMDLARTVCGTLFKAFKDMPNVEIHVIGWTTGGGYGSNVGVHIVKNFEDVDTLHSSGGTPFTDATIYCGEYVRNLPQKKKILFQITDGDVYIQNETKVYLADLRKRGIIVKGLHVGEWDNGGVMKLFGNQNALHFKNMASVNKVLTQEIAGQFMRYMRS